VTRDDDIAAALHAMAVHVPAGVLGTLVDMAWRQGFSQSTEAAWTWPSAGRCWSARGRAPDSTGGRRGRRLVRWLTSWGAWHGRHMPRARRYVGGRWSVVEQLQRDLTLVALTTRRLP
jgi:hypothetical protein